MFTMAFAASPMPAADVLAAWATVEDGLSYYAISTDEWAPVAAALGDEKLMELGILASIDDEDLKTARDSIKMSPIKRGPSLGYSERLRRSSRCRCCLNAASCC